MPAKMRAVSLTRLQRWPLVISLRIRNPCQSDPVTLNCASASTGAGVSDGRQGQVHISNHDQRTHRLCGERRRDFHEYRLSCRLRAALAQGLYHGLAGRCRTGLFRNSTRSPRDRNDRQADRRTSLESYCAGLISSVSPILFTVAPWSSSAAANSAGVPGFTTWPVALSFDSISGSLRTSRISVAMRSRTFCGKSRGPSTPTSPSNSNDLYPASDAVGISSSALACWRL